MKEQNGKKKLEEFRRQPKKKMGPEVFSGNREAISKRKEKRRFRTILENTKIGSTFQNIGGDTEEKVLENAEMGGGQRCPNGRFS